MTMKVGVISQLAISCLARDSCSAACLPPRNCYLMCWSDQTVQATASCPNVTTDLGVRLQQSSDELCCFHPVQVDGLCDGLGTLR